MRGHRAPDRGGARPRRRPRWPRSSSAAGTWRSPTRCPTELRNRLGIAVAKHAYRAYRELLDSERWQRLAERGRPAAAAALREHRHQGPRRLRHALHRGARGPVHDQHDARQDPARVRRPRRGRRPAAGRRRRRRAGARRVRGRGRRRRRAGRPASARGRGGVRQVVERAHAVDRRRRAASSPRPGEPGESAPSPPPTPERSPGNATRNDRTGAHGRQHGAPPDARRTTSASSSTSTPTPCQQLAGEGAVGAESVEDLVAKLDAAARRVADGARRGGRQDARRPRPAARVGRRRDRRRQLLLPGRHPPRRRGWPSTTSTTWTPGRAAASGGSTAATA